MKKKKKKVEEEKISSQTPIREVTEIFFRLFFYIFLAFLAVFMCWYGYFVLTHSFYEVRGASMMPTLNNAIPYNQMESASNIHFDSVHIKEDINLFDVVIIKRPTDEESIIKRLIAQEGDYITIAKVEDEEGNASLKLFRIAAGTNLQNFSDEQAMLEEKGENGYQILEPDILWVHKTNKSFSNPTIEVTIDVDEKSYTNQYEYNFYTTFLSGYDPEDEQSEYNYFVSDAGLLYVQVPEGQFFYLGDNRAHSTDARERGFCDNQYILGSVDYVIQDNNFFARIFSMFKIFFGKIEKFFAR